MQIVAALAFGDSQEPFDLVLVASGPGLPHARSDRAMMSWLRAVAQRSTPYGSICTGAFALGHVGLLGGHRVTTHWQLAQKLAA
jgi:transcriptional regulator GlxA family with amidase domain